MIARHWQQMTDDEKHAFVAETVRSSCEAQGIPEFVTDPADLEPAVRAVLAVAIPLPAAPAAAGRGIGASNRARATADLRGSGSTVGTSSPAASVRRSNKNTTRTGSTAKNARPSSPYRKGA